MPWPTFIICGMKKAATTSLYEYFQQHPDIYMSPIKETKYFIYDPNDSFFVDAPLSKYPIRTEQEYLALFDGVAHERAIGEASPSYVISARARRQIASTLPDVKLIFSLRHPVDRFYSAYQMGVRGGSIDLPFDEYVEENQDLLSQFEYCQFLRPWIDEFNRSRLRFVLSENLKRSPLNELKQLYQFLGVDASFSPMSLPQHNSGGIPKNKSMQQVLFYFRKHPYKRTFARILPQSTRNMFHRFYASNLVAAPAMSSATRAFLSQRFAQDMEELATLIDVDLSVWYERDKTRSSSAQPS